jgi:hypothetical protein
VCLFRSLDFQKHSAFAGITFTLIVSNRVPTDGFSTGFVYPHPVTTLSQGRRFPISSVLNDHLFFTFLEKTCSFSQFRVKVALPTAIEA